MSKKVPSSRANSLCASVVWKVLVLCVAALTGCTSIQKTPARFYALNDGKIIRVQLYHLNDGHGRATAMMPDGSVLEGNYSLASVSDHSAEQGAHPAAPESGRADITWAERYGYSTAADPHPRGTGTLKSGTGFNIHFVIYSINIDGGYGTGLARDNKGTWYRLHVGEPN